MLKPRWISKTLYGKARHLNHKGHVPIYVIWPGNETPESELMFGGDGTGGKIKYKQIQVSHSDLQKDFNYEL